MIRYEFCLNKDLLSMQSVSGRGSEIGCSEAKYRPCGKGLLLNKILPKIFSFKAKSMTEEAERRPREMQEELEVEKKKKTVELEELAKEMEKEYENRVKKALAQLRFPLVVPVVQVVPFNIVSCRDVHSDQLKQKAHDFDKKFEKKVNLKRLKLKILL